ncbi:hypothetical protein OHA79_49015 (plasmid) [Streptomyces sp. NBC_00841]|uniref:hypothetical protein n=1 Tax=Streptomyces sp. NBC_00841 TaxID=2975847 RepID=UPI002DD9AD54|nr:hypothetical protein [Streptomyces sp. NBC_00841]WSA05458.1 hypothetical protein OHA79_49015 [Streptomyces sp. NBC_00841]
MILPQEIAEPRDPAEVLSKTAWSALGHAYGTAEDVPQMLLGLMDTDLRVRSKALSHLHQVVHHQNTLYTATAPAAVYVAAILGDARTLQAVEKGPHGFPGPMRAELLGWLGSVANEADDEAAAVSRRFGFPPEDYPPFVEICRIRPQLFHAVSAFLNDPDTDVRAAAISACIPLLDDPRLIHHRDALAPLLRDVLAASALWQYRERAIDTLANWGQDTTGLEVRQEGSRSVTPSTSLSHGLSRRRAATTPIPPSEGFLAVAPAR